jgi:G:T/U-mismatch repair DNA glycosylase
MEFFYGSVANNFWDCLGSITGNDVNNLNDRLEVLNNSKIGITDILGKIKRDPNHCNSDKCLSAINYNDILYLKEHFPALKNIFVTSGGRGPVLNLNGNNGNAARWLKNSVANQNIGGFNQPGFVKSISINQIEFNLVYLFSPSKTANRYLKRKMNEHNNFGIQNLSIQEFRKMQWAYFLRTYHFGENVNFTIDGLWNTVINNHYLVDFFD